MPRWGPQGSKLQNLNEWGSALQMFCLIIGTNMTAIAARAGIHETTLYKASKGKNHPTEWVVDRLWQAIVEMAEEHDQQEPDGLRYLDYLEPTVKEAWWNLAPHVTKEQQGAARQRMASLRNALGYMERIESISQQLVKSEQANEKETLALGEQERIIREQRHLIAQQQRTIRHLQREITKLQGPRL